MPLVQVTVVAGRPPAQLRALIAALHRAVVSTLDGPAERVRVILHEVPASHWAAGGRTIAERDSSPDSSSDSSPDWSPDLSPDSLPGAGEGGAG